MSVLRRLFGKRAPAAPPDVSDIAERLYGPAVQVVTCARATRSHFGGDPALPAEIAWPTRGGKQLTFLARISLSELADVHRFEWLPHAGALLFFYDTEEMPWGFDPKDRGGWCVMLVPDVDPRARVGIPPGTKALPARSVEFISIRTLPSWERPQVATLALSDAESEALMSLAEASYSERPKHQIGGFPQCVQGDAMELECQLASHGVYCGDASGFKSSEGLRLAPGATDWHLLFQIDTDDELQVMWGDGGMLYFWVQSETSAAGEFTNAWLILQCG
jgi:uncharacterized protein YwqG